MMPLTQQQFQISSYIETLLPTIKELQETKEFLQTVSLAARTICNKENKAKECQKLEEQIQNLQFTPLQLRQARSLLQLPPEENLTLEQNNCRNSILVTSMNTRITRIQEKANEYQIKSNHEIQKYRICFQTTVEKFVQDYFSMTESKPTAETITTIIESLVQHISELWQLGYASKRTLFARNQRTQAEQREKKQATVPMQLSTPISEMSSSDLDNHISKLIQEKLKVSPKQTSRSILKQNNPHKGILQEQEILQYPEQEIFQLQEPHQDQEKLKIHQKGKRHRAHFFTSKIEQSLGSYEKINSELFPLPPPSPLPIHLSTSSSSSSSFSSNPVTNKHLHILGNINLTAHQKHLLSMGPKFIPKPPSISKHEIYQSLKEFTRRIAIKDFFNHKPYSTSNSGYHPYLQKPTKSTWSPPFIPSASVRTMIQNLKNDIETLVEDKIPTQKTIPVAWKILKSLPPTVKVVL
ncbi:hypothetical protein HMI54_007530 [Coelomomyces lativittatus]|nr:hypothetical protein HMI54_007530 [Coelomomyces lativittatus]